MRAAKREYVRAMKKGDRDALIKFFHAEFGGQDRYEALAGFVGTDAIRSGRYEGNEYVLEKLGPESFLMYREDEYPGGWVEVSDAALLAKDELLADLTADAERDGFDLLPPAAPSVGALPEEADIVAALARTLAEDRPSYVLAREFMASPLVTEGDLEVAGAVVRKLRHGNFLVYRAGGEEAGPAAAVGADALGAALDEAVLARGLVPVPGWPTERSLVRSKGGVRNEARCISREECGRLLASIDHSSTFVAVIEGSRYRDWEGFVDDIAEIFDFPMRDQRNPNAFLDWICDLDWLGKEAYALFILDFPRFMEDNPRDKKWIIGLFTQLVLPFWEREVEQCVVGGRAKPFDLYLVD